MCVSSTVTIVGNGYMHACERSGLPQDVSNSIHYHYLEDIYDLLNEADVDASQFLGSLGETLVTSSAEAKLLKFLGGDLTTFLTTLDGVLDVIQGQGSDQEVSKNT
ncbi:hypothetical protein LSTR_LSTR014315 [Laodelphax striatellus]|uniref:Uncharacterized protein n=1 Tax=Laodelphax striatellus TaxID=195883 RepID=A0A482XIC3_LAOST|nr:hypothetical protein LSTR_LSTR014315 [Laodelphax striatellus]